ncbi:MAG: OsmC family peroxiredoxin [Bacteroidetes bacterium]|nr:MAG: OsmC family peroxiredoxin [Bacteroidota bacterium]
MKRKATAIWKGTGKEGKGVLNTPSEVFNNTPYSFNTRFEDGKGTNPEELIAAAHAGCFNMALSFMLVGAGFVAEELDCTATVVLESKNGGFDVTSIVLDLNAKIPNINQAKFDELAANAKANCPISKLFNAPITLNAKLLS